MKRVRGWAVGLAWIMGVATLLLVPSVAHWASRLSVEPAEVTRPRSLRPARATGHSSEAGPAEPVRSPALRAPEPQGPLLQADLGTTIEPSVMAQPAASRDPSGDDDALATDEPSVVAQPAPPAVAAEPASPPEQDRTEPERMRQVELSALQSRTQPGLCDGSNDAVEAREALIARFHAIGGDGDSQLYLDPRLPAGAQHPLLSNLEQTEREIRELLGLAPPRPDVFAYFDTQLLLAAACTNDDVVAYYDGALHVVLSHADVLQSILHEYTHHALMTSGLIGPAWAQEGIAMHVARESWWRGGGWLERVLERPFSLAVMESAIPYTMSSEQAVLFYVQSAAMVACAIRGGPTGLAGLVETLAATQERGRLRYELPALAGPSAWRDCFGGLAR